MHTTKWKSQCDRCSNLFQVLTFKALALHLVVRITEIKKLKLNKFDQNR